MQNVFNLPRRLLLALAVVLVALTVFSTHQLMYAGTTGAFGALVLSCAGLLALLVVAGLGHAVDVLKPLLEAQVGNAAASMPSPLSHRQNLEQCVAREVIHSAMSWSGDGDRAGKMARNALDALMGAGESAQCPSSDAVKMAAYHNALKDAVYGVGQAAEPKTASRVTPADIEAEIVREHYFTGEQGAAHVDSLAKPHDFGDVWKSSNLSLLTICVLVLRNGFKVVGVNYGDIDPARHDPVRGQVEARAAAIEQVWPLMGYELRSKLSA